MKKNSTTLRKTQITCSLDMGSQISSNKLIPKFTFIYTKLCLRVYKVKVCLFEIIFENEEYNELMREYEYSRYRLTILVAPQKRHVSSCKVN